MRRALQELVEDPLTGKYLDGDFVDGDTVKIVKKGEKDVGFEKLRVKS